MAIVIGLDFGNFNSYPSYIEDLDGDRTRLGGKPVDLVSANDSRGIPSVFFYDGKGSFLTCKTATTGLAKPERNQVRYLKRSLGMPLEVGGAPVIINGKKWLYDDAIREVVQGVLQEANRVLQQRTLTTTNLVSLAYPATFSSTQREQLINIVQSARTETGEHFKVLGTVMEPAAAALDYLSVCKCTEDTTVLVFDLGGGTFDLSLVTCYPNGKRRADGSMCYYDIHISDGLEKVGGLEFDEVIYDLLHTKLQNYLTERNQPMKGVYEGHMRLNAERVKKELTDSERTVYEAYIHTLDEGIELELTREEFEKHPRVQAMLKQMTDKAVTLLKEPNLPKPKTIVLTGGASQMPMIPAALAAVMPEYANDLLKNGLYKPETAISYGAARYGMPEVVPPTVRGTKPTRITGTDINAAKPIGDEVVIKRVAYDVGIRYYIGKNDQTGYIKTFLKRGRELPFKTDWYKGLTIYPANNTSYRMYEANKKAPDTQKPEEDYRFIQMVRVEFGEDLPENTETELRLLADKDGLVRMEARKDSKSRLFAVNGQIQTQS